MPRKSHGLSPEEAARLLAPLGHAARVRLLLLLLERGEASAGALQAAVGLTQVSASHHLRVLHQPGLVACRRAGRRCLYRVTAPAAADVLRLACGP